MGKKIVILLPLLYLFLSDAFGENRLPLDSILYKTMNAAERHNRLVESFQAEVYMRTYVETVRRNFLHRFAQHIPQLVLHDPNNDEALIEILGTLRFEYPNNYMLDLNYVTGTLTRRRDLELMPFNLLNINVYSETINDESFFMPTRFSTARYYNYTLYNTFTENGTTFFVIHFAPIHANTRLLRGYFIVESDTWRITFFRGEGLGVFTNFSFDVTMGNEFITRFLPQDFIIRQTTSYLGNIIESRHLARISYTDIVLLQDREPVRRLNISDFYRIRLDSVPVLHDAAFWDKNRPIPLNINEIEVMRQFNERQQQELERRAQTDSIADAQRVQLLAQRMIIMPSSHQFRATRIGYSGLLNPAMLALSSYSGLSYSQRLLFNIDLFRGRQTLNINAFGGYMFHRREFFSDITTRWNYRPFQMGSVTLSFGNNNPSFSSLFIEEVQDSLRLSGLTFDDISLPFFRNYFIRLFNTNEITNGLLLSAGIEYNIRTARGNQIVTRAANNDDSPGNIEDLFGTRRSFVPFVRVSWTPEQHYRLDARQKIHVRSRFPTFKLDVSRSFQNILGSTSEYSRIEFNVHHRIQLGLLQSFSYQVGAGVFLNQRTEYFADFAFFSRRNFPASWDDNMGGVFNLLGRTWFNASASYIQAHLMYETPFLLLKAVPFTSRLVERERFYFSQLYTPQMVSYTEIGYGISNRFFSVAAFASFHRTQFQRFGVRVGFEL